MFATKKKLEFKVANRFTANTVQNLNANKSNLLLKSLYVNIFKYKSFYLYLYLNFNQNQGCSFH